MGNSACQFYPNILTIGMVQSCLGCLRKAEHPALVGMERKAERMRSSGIETEVYLRCTFNESGCMPHVQVNGWGWQREEILP